MKQKFGEKVETITQLQKLPKPFVRKDLEQDTINTQQLEQYFKEQMCKIVDTIACIDNKKEINEKINEYGLGFPAYAQCREDCPWISSLLPLSLCILDNCTEERLLF